MPIYDRDATDIMYEIKEVRDYDTTTNYIIKEVRDYDATNTSYIIYTSQSPDSPTLLNLSDQATEITGGWTMANNGGSAYQWQYKDNGPAGWYMSFSGNNANGQGWMTTNQPVEISGYATLTLTSWYQKGYGDAAAGSGYIYIALTTNTDYAGGAAGSATMKGSNVVKSAVVLTSASSGTATVVLDVSGVDGSYYVQIGRWNKTSACVFTSALQTVILS